METNLPKTEEKDTFFTASTIVDWYEEFMPKEEILPTELHSEMYY